MKKILIFIFILLMFKAKGQTPQAPIIFTTIEQMQAYTGSFYQAWVKDTVRGGLFTGVINAAYTVDNAIIFQGVGRQWLRQVTQSGGYKISWWVQADSTVDCARKINQAILYAFHQNGQIDTLGIPIREKTRAYSTRPHIIFDAKLYGIDTTVVPLGYVITDFNGCGFKDISTNGVRYMISTPNSANETTEIPPTSPYYDYSGNYAFNQSDQVIGNFILNGNYRAKNGIQIETSPFGLFQNAFITNIQGNSWGRGAVTIAQNKTVSFDSTIDPDDSLANTYDRWVIINDPQYFYRSATFVIYRQSENRYLRGIYQISKLGTNDTLWSQADFQENMVVGDQVISVPTGYILNSNQFTTLNVAVTQSGLGVMVGRNKNGVLYDDNTFYSLHLTDNNWGIAFNRVARSTVYHSSLQRSNFGNIEILEGLCINIHDAYIETSGRRNRGSGNADSLLYNENYSSVYIDCDGCEVGSLGPVHPDGSSDSDGLHNFFRYYEVDGRSNKLELVMGFISFLGHTSTHGDSAMIRMRQMRTPMPSIYVSLQGSYSFNQLRGIASLVVDSSYNSYTNANIYGYGETLNTVAFGQAITSTKLNYAQQGSTSYFNSGNQNVQPSLKIDNTGIRFGAGNTVAPAATIGFFASNYIAVSALKILNVAAGNSSNKILSFDPADSTIKIVNQNPVFNMVYIDSSERNITSTITWVNTGSSPSGTPTNTYRWTRTGNEVKVRFNLKYSVPGSNCTAVQIELPSDMPTPSRPSGYNAANNQLNTGSGQIMVNTTTPNTDVQTAALLVNSGNTGYIINIGGIVNVNAAAAEATITYWTAP